MKKYLISAVAVLAVLTVTLVMYAQAQAAGRAGEGQGGRPESRMRGGMMRYTESLQAAITEIEKQVGKLKENMEAQSAMPRFRRTEEGGEMPSQEEMAKMREQRVKMREQQQAAVAAIEQQLMILKGRQLQTEHEESIAELEAVHKLSLEENAKKTAERIQDMIAKRNKAFEDTVEKLGIRLGRPRRQGEGGMMGGGPGQSGMSGQGQRGMGGGQRQGGQRGGGQQ
jgi:DNA anti-recombination protein RmuC